MRCLDCGAENPTNYTICSACGVRRVIDLSGTSSPRTAAQPRGSSSRRRHATTPTTPTAASQRLIANPGGGTSRTSTAPPPVYRGTSPQPPIPTNPAMASSGSSGPAASSQRFARDATRYLCVAVQSDSRLNEQMIENTVNAGARAVASSPGVDLATVIRYGLAARARQLIRDAMLLAVVILALVLSESHEDAALLFGGLGTVLIVFAEKLYTTYAVLSPKLRRTTFDPAAAPDPLSQRAQARIAEIAARDRGNVTVFGTYDPFIGRGTRFAGFEFAMSLRAKEGQQAKPFTMNNAYDHVTDSLRKLGLPGLTVENELFVCGFDLLDQLDPATAKLLLPEIMKAPATSVDEATMRRLRDDVRGRARPYVAIRIAGWSGELVVTVLMRLALAGQSDALYLETHYLLLPPVHERYRDVDRLSSFPTIQQIALVAFRSLWQTPSRVYQAFTSIRKLLLSPLTNFWDRIRERWAIQHDRNFNYGSLYSVREAAAFTIVPRWTQKLGATVQRYTYARHFQSSDRHLYAEMAASRIMGALVEFLDARGYDAQELATRQMTINNGTILGNNANISNAAFSGGPGSKARNAAPAKAKPAAGRT